MQPARSRRVRLLTWLALVSAILLGAYSCSGYVMLASMSGADPERLASEQRTAWIFLALTGGSLVAAVAMIVILIRQARPSTGSRTN
jgi:hypothetical protein